MSFYVSDLLAVVLIVVVGCTIANTVAVATWAGWL